MKAFNTIEELSLEQCFELLRREEVHPFAEQIQQQYDSELKKWKIKENNDFLTCKTISDYEQYLARYDNLSFYQIHFKEAALQKIEFLFWRYNNSSIKKCNRYLNKYPQGKYVTEAKQKIKTYKRKRWGIAIFILLLLGLVCFLAYKPSGDISLSKDSLRFSKYGETLYTALITPKDANNIEVSVSPSCNWLQVERRGNQLNITADKNPVEEKHATITIRAYTTFFGQRLFSTTKDIPVCQESGMATEFSISKKNFEFDKYGNAKEDNSFILKTNGVDYSVTCSSGYVHIKKEVQSKPKSPHVVKIVLSLDTNESETKSAVVNVSSGRFKERVIVSQESGLATEFNVSRTNISASKSGTGEGKCYWVDVTTNGTKYYTRVNKKWLHVEQYSKHFEITVEENFEDVRTGKVYVSSNNGHEYTISVTQDGNPSDFSLSRTSYTFNTESDSEYFTITNNSNQPVSCYTYNDSWLHPSIVNGKLKIKCDKNTGSPKDGTVYVKCGDKKVSISIHQKGWVNCTCCYNPYVGYSTGQLWNIYYGTVLCSCCGGSGKIKEN